MLSRDQKKEQSEQVRETLDGIETLFVMENVGLTVNQVNQLRSQVRGVEGSQYRVIKNSVVRLAVEGTPLAGLAEHLTGPNAYAFTSGDAVALAKALKVFAKDHPALSFKLAFLEGEILAAEDAVKVAELPTRDELLSRLVYILQSPMRRLVTALNGPLQQLASALGQIADAKQS